jgi:hypothetical protein
MSFICDDQPSQVFYVKYLTFVVAVFVTKQLPPFSHGFVRQKTNCERLPVATEILPPR